MVVEVIYKGNITGIPLIIWTFHLFFRTPGSWKAGTGVGAGVGVGAGRGITRGGDGVGVGVGAGVGVGVGFDGVFTEGAWTSGPISPVFLIWAINFPSWLLICIIFPFSS